MIPTDITYGNFLFLLAPLLIWTLIWKGLALWKSARNSHKAWFIIMLVVNTVGILEIIYLLMYRERKDSTPPTV